MIIKLNLCLFFCVRFRGRVRGPAQAYRWRQDLGGDLVWRRSSSNADDDDCVGLDGGYADATGAVVGRRRCYLAS